MTLVPRNNPVKRILDAIKAAKKISIGTTGTTDFRGDYSAPTAPGNFGGALDDLSDVDASSPNNNDIIAFNSGSGNWEAGANPAGADEKVKATALDGVSDYLHEKHVAGTGVSITTIDKGGGDLAEQFDSNDGEIDHNALANTHNLTTDIDHNSITNTHNLTTDIDHGSISGLGDDDHPWAVNKNGRVTGQQIYGGTGAGEQLRLDGSDDGDGDVVINGDFTIDPNGAHENAYNGIVVAAPGVVPDTASVVFANPLPDTDYTIEPTGQIHEYVGPFVIMAEPGVLMLAGVHVSTTWQIIPGTKTVNGFSVSALHTVTDSTAGTEPGIGGWSICPHHSTLLGSLAAFYTFVAHADNYTCNWAVRRF